MTEDLYRFIIYSAELKQGVIILGFIAVLFCIFTKSPRVTKSRVGSTIAFVLAGIFVYLLGNHPVGYGTYADRQVYSMWFDSIASGQSEVEIGITGDRMFGYFMYIVSLFGDIYMFFFVQSAFYVFLYLIVCYRLGKENSLWLFLGCLLSMGFTAYGINTLRAGMAIAIVLLGITFDKTLWKRLALFVLALGVHFSMAIPITMILISQFYDRTRLFFILWILSIPLSFIVGTYFNSIFSTLGDDARAANYLVVETESAEDGFRLDFIVYSLVPLAVGYYYVFKRKFESKLYRNIYNAYILTNIFWILVIRANYSDRFAYLSWFMIPFVLLMPIVRDPRIVKNPTLWLSLILLGETLFKMIK